MESFKDLLQKLQEVHEQEVEGWQVKVKELSNKKGCDSKRMEELFTRNQQMKEQHRLLTENIKTLENRLRAGLCDRCTVTQELAKRKQQDYEASQIQSLQHISLLAGEMTNLKKENLRLKDEIRNLRAALGKGHSDNFSNNSNAVDIKPIICPDLSPSPGVVALVSPTVCKTSNQPADGDVGVKTEADHRDEIERRHLRGSSRSSFEVFRPQPTAAIPSWKTEHGLRSIEGFDQHSCIPIQAPLKSTSSSPEVKPSRTVVHAPIPCHPKPIKSSPISLPWPLSESSDWVTVAAAGSSPTLQPSSRLHLPHYPNLMPPIPQANTRRTFGPAWPKQITHQPPAKEPTVVFKLRRLPDYPESETKPPEKKESSPFKSERVSGEGPKDSCDGPLDLSDRGKSKSNQSPNNDSPAAQTGAQRIPENTLSSPGSSPSLVILPSSSCTATARKPEQEPTSDQSKEVKDQEQKEEVTDKTDQSNGKKIPVLTLSLRPAVVRLETLNSALQKQEMKSSNGKQKCVTVVSPCASSASSQSSSSANEAESSLDEREDESESGQESNLGCKRKRASVETETDRDSDANNNHQDRRIKITVRPDDRS